MFIRLVFTSSGVNRCCTVAILLLYLCLLPALPAIAQSNLSTDQIEAAAFKNPLRQDRVNTWWHFIDNFITKEGITKDLEAMQQQGISGATILNVNQFDGKLGNATVKFGSVEWYDMFKYALQEASRLNMEIGVQNCDGWSTSGGPWITPEQSMKQYIWSKTFISGGSPVNVKLNQSVSNNNFYRDAAVVAYRSGKPNSFQLAAPKMTTADGKNNTAVLSDGYPLSTINMKVGESLLIAFEKDFKAEVLQVFTQRMSSKKGTKQITVFQIESSMDGIHFDKVGEVADSIVNEMFLVPFPSTNAKVYRITLSAIQNSDTEKEMRIGEIALLQKGEKPLFQSLIPAHAAKTVALSAGDIADFYQLYPPVNSKDVIPAATDVVDLTSQMQPDGTLHWNAPSGDWTIIRFGYTTTGKKNHPATKEGIGLECNKMDTTALNLHFNSFPQKLIEAAGSLKGKTFTYLLSDSWEALYQNWTLGFEREFEKRRGYSLIPYIPVLCGEVVESSSHAEAFLHDFRRTIADLIEENYFKHLSELCHRNGLQLHCEAIYGGIKTPPLDVLKTYRYFDVPMTEFWAPINVRDTPFTYPANNRMTATLPIHAAFLYNKSVVAAESYTGFALYSDAPWDLKLYGDNALTEGVNHFVLHSYVHQPTEAKPGLTLGMYGLSFNRHNTWWPYASAFFNEQARAQYLLDKGSTVSDVLVYLGDKLPVQEAAEKTAMLLPDVRYNYCNADVLYNRVSVKDGKLMLDNKFPFQFLLLQDSVLDLATLKKIQALVSKGATVVAPRPSRTLSLSGYERNNDSLQIIASEMWGNIDGKTVTQHTYGKGKIIWGQSLKSITHNSDFTPDIQVKGGQLEDLMYIHKKTGDRDIYYVVNKNPNKVQQLEIQFRIAGAAPQLWDPMDGAIYKPALYYEKEGTTILPLSLRSKQSIFVVFQKGVIQPHFIQLNDASGRRLFPADTTVSFPLPKVYFDGVDGTVNISSAGGRYDLVATNGRTIPVTVPEHKETIYSTIAGTITLQGEPTLAPIPIDSFRSLTSYKNDQIKYYSGTATYDLNLNLQDSIVQGRDKIYLKVKQFGAAACVYVNGGLAGTIWEPDYPLDITSLAKAKNNKLVIEVANPWRNRLIGDMISSRGVQNAWTTSPFKENGATDVLNKNSFLLNSGISQPIIVCRESVVKVRLPANR